MTQYQAGRAESRTLRSPKRSRFTRWQRRELQAHVVIMGERSICLHALQKVEDIVWPYVFDGNRRTRLKTIRYALPCTNNKPAHKTHRDSTGREWK